MKIIETKNINGFALQRVQLTDNMYLDEYIPFKLYKRNVTRGDYFYGWGENYLELLCRKINKNLVASDQMLRNLFGPVTINDWWIGGAANFRGFRYVGCGVGTEMSDHYQGNASDKHFKYYDAEEVRDYIRKNWRRFGITIIEENVSWVHTSVAWIPDQFNLKSVYP